LVKSFAVWRKALVSKQAPLLQQIIKQAPRMALVRLRIAIKTLGRQSMDITCQAVSSQGVRNYSTERQTWYCRINFSGNVASRGT